MEPVDLQAIKDNDLLNRLRQLVLAERSLLTRVLHHLREVERRKLYCDLGYQSLFEYAVKELNYSEGQAGRRIQAMRLLNELPEVAEKIETGKLSLSNISYAQNYFRAAKKSAIPVGRQEKLSLLERLENKSAREAQITIASLNPPDITPPESERIIDQDRSEIRFVMSTRLKSQLEEVRSLLGPEGACMNLAELISCMAEISAKQLKREKFGGSKTKKTRSSTPTTPTSESQRDKEDRYIPASVRSTVWERDQGKCTNCGGRRNLNFDHIRPVARGGRSTFKNIRLLCFNCNQRQAIKLFGLNHIEKFSAKTSPPSIHSIPSDSFHDPKGPECAPPPD